MKVVIDTSSLLSLVRYYLPFDKQTILYEANEELFLATEESEFSNDDKLFKKIPAICSQLGIQTINIQQLIDKLEGIEIEIK